MDGFFCRSFVESALPMRMAGFSTKKYEMGTVMASRGSRKRVKVGCAGKSIAGIVKSCCQR